MIAILLSNWKPIAIFLALIALFMAGWHTGVSHYKVEAQKELNEAIEQQRKKSEMEQKKLNNVAVDLSRQLSVEQQKSKTIEEKLSHERTNKAYSCIIPPSGVQLFNSTLP